MLSIGSETYWLTAEACSLPQLQCKIVVFSFQKACLQVFSPILCCELCLDYCFENEAQLSRQLTDCRSIGADEETHLEWLEDVFGAVLVGLFGRKLCLLKLQKLTPQDLKMSEKGQINLTFVLLTLQWCCFSLWRCEASGPLTSISS